MIVYPYWSAFIATNDTFKAIKARLWLQTIRLKLYKWVYSYKWCVYSYKNQFPATNTPFKAFPNQFQLSPYTSSDSESISAENVR